ncbi:type II toxin-antitoxin system HicB family antitoxin [uncultured Thiodictyon sp.]|uniref:type II toxin-antitoxin system HicB family antitoxin n=1 Tax=uncultured Thiodictyon sp. TaxID=1846217 RepID=UPI0025EE8238|nr:type II toxin-antitoxin system HicB family antitoxin [uncultured Thiodictyon sp.]
MNDDVKTCPCAAAPWPFEAYAYTISPVPAEDGGGFLMTFPDLPGCMADGATAADAIANARAAFTATVSSLYALGREIPAPTFSPDTAGARDAAGRLVARLPKSIHTRLAYRAKAEGVSINALALTFIVEGLGRREPPV